MCIQCLCKDPDTCRNKVRLSTFDEEWRTCGRSRFQVCFQSCNLCICFFQQTLRLELIFMCTYGRPQLFQLSGEFVDPHDQLTQNVFLFSIPLSLSLPLRNEFPCLSIIDLECSLQVQKNAQRAPM